MRLRRGGVSREKSNKGESMNPRRADELATEVLRLAKERGAK